MKLSFLAYILSIIGTSQLAIAATTDKVAPSGGHLIADTIYGLSDRDCGKIDAIIARLSSDKETVDPAAVSRAYDLSIACAVRAKNWPRSIDLSRHITAFPESLDYAWHSLVGVDFEVGNYADGIDAIERMRAVGRDGAVNSIDPRWLMRTLFLLEKNGDTLNEGRLLAVMSSQTYDPDDAQAQIEDIRGYARGMYARLELAAGNRDVARQLLSEVSGYETLTRIAFEPELASLLGHPVDLRAEAESDLSRHQRLLDKFPRALSAIVEVSFDLHRLGRNDEDIAFLTAAMPRVASSSFDDEDKEASFFWNQLAEAYFSVGKYDEMIASEEKANPVASPDPDVDLTVDLAENQFEFRRPEAAVATLDRLGSKPDSSPYGLMQIAYLRGCAAAELGKLNETRAQLAYAIAHEADDPGAVTLLEVCVGDEDAAAASYVRRLHDTNPDNRRKAILALADYDPTDPRYPRSIFADQMDRVSKRSDVQSALRQATGGSVRIHLPEG